MQTESSHIPSQNFSFNFRINSESFSEQFLNVAKKTCWVALHILKFFSCFVSFIFAPPLFFIGFIAGVVSKDRVPKWFDNINSFFKDRYLLIVPFALCAYVARPVAIPFVFVYMGVTTSSYFWRRPTSQSLEAN